MDSLYPYSHVSKIWMGCPFVTNFAKRGCVQVRRFLRAPDLRDPVKNRMLAFVTLWWKKSSQFFLSLWVSLLKFIARCGLRTRSWIVSNFTLRYHGKICLSPAWCFVLVFVTKHEVRETYSAHWLSRMFLRWGHGLPSPRRLLQWIRHVVGLFWCGGCRCATLWNSSWGAAINTGSHFLVL